MRDVLGQGGQLSRGAGLRHREVEGEEVEVRGIELEIPQRAPREEEVRQRRTTPGDRALQPLHHVAARGKVRSMRRLRRSSAACRCWASEARSRVLRRSQELLRLAGRLRERRGGLRLGLTMVEDRQGDADAHEQALVLVLPEETNWSSR
jgi:hypothetical protein